MSEESKDGLESRDLTEIADNLERQDVKRWVTEDPQTSSVSRNRSTAYLDGLRGLAAFFVYMSHNVPWFYGFDEQGDSLERGYGDGAKDFAMLPFVRVFFTGGSSAVAIFFVLSGYVLSRGPLGMLHEGQTNKCYKSLISATVRRPVRLFLPPAMLSLIFAGIMQLPFGLSPKMSWPEAKDNVFAELFNFVSEFSRIINPFTRHDISTRWYPYNPPLWTIAIEFRGSIVVFALLAVTARMNAWLRFWIFNALGVVLLLSYQWSMFCFMAGVALAINDIEGYDLVLYRRVSPQMRIVIPTIVFMVGWFLISEPGGKRDPKLSLNAPGFYYLTKMIPRTYWLLEFWRYWQAWGSALVVYGVLKVKLLQRFFGSENLRLLGKVSFCLYLIHIPFLWTMGDRVYRIFGLARQDFTTVWDNLVYIQDIGPRGLSTRFIITQAFILPINLILASIATTYIDEPSVRASRWLAAKLLSRKPVVSEKPMTLRDIVQN